MASLIFWADTIPLSSGVTNVASSRLAAAKTAWCSIVAVTTWPEILAKAKLIDSVAPAVITKSSAFVPIARAMVCLAASYSRRTATAGAYGADGLKNISEKNGCIAARTFESTGVAAA